MELDNKFDIDISDYFNLSEKDKDELADIVVGHYFNLIKQDHRNLGIITVSIRVKLEDLIEEEKYEMADLYKRILKKLGNLHL